VRTAGVVVGPRGRGQTRLTSRWSGPQARIRSPRPLNADVDMTSAVNSHDALWVAGVPRLVDEDERGAPFDSMRLTRVERRRSASSRGSHTV
jgi:hypothetical protein